MQQVLMYNIINKLKQLYKWIANDGLLHILICMILMLSFYLIIGYALSLLITITFGLIKEIYDYFIQKDNNKEQVKHDVICNSIGIVISNFIILLHYFIN